MHSKTNQSGLAVALALTLGGIALAGDFQIPWHSIDGGGGMQSTGGAFSLSGTIGQPDAGRMGGNTFELTGGFWAADTDLVPCPNELNSSRIDEWIGCLQGPELGLVAPICDCWDSDGDGDIDLLDIADWQNAFDH